MVAGDKSFAGCTFRKIGHLGFNIQIAWHSGAAAESEKERVWCTAARKHHVGKIWILLDGAAEVEDEDIFKAFLWVSEPLIDSFPTQAPKVLGPSARISYTLKVIFLFCSFVGVICTKKVADQLTNQWWAPNVLLEVCLVVSLLDRVKHGRHFKLNPVDLFHSTAFR